MVRACKKSRWVTTELNLELTANVFRRLYFRFARFYAAFNFWWAYFDSFSWRVHLGVDYGHTCSEKPFRASLSYINFNSKPLCLVPAASWGHAIINAICRLLWWMKIQIYRNILCTVNSLMAVFLFACIILSCLSVINRWSTWNLKTWGFKVNYLLAITLRCQLSPACLCPKIS